jgi:carboxypeptidase PM20D1
MMTSGGGSVGILDPARAAIPSLPLLVPESGRAGWLRRRAPFGVARRAPIFRQRGAVLRRAATVDPHPPSMKKLLLATGAALLLLLGVVAARTARFGAPQRAVEPAPLVAVPAAAAERLAGAIRFPTIAHPDPDSLDAAPFLALHDYLERSFPRVHATLGRERVNGLTLLFSWAGSDPSLRPILLMGHLDVVPVEEGTEADWQQPPFGGRIVGGAVWGRGAIDNKPSVLGTLEAVEMLLAEGFRPARTILLAYGHDEEVGGRRGAAAVAALLRERGVEPEMVLDEGGVVGEGLMPGVVAPTALVGIAEKGYLSVELSTRSEGGHSSMPPSRTAIGVLGGAVARLEGRPLPARLAGATGLLFEHVGPELPLAQRAVFANLWLTRPLVIRILARSPSTDAAVRTTTATTIFEAGTQDNVLASQARAVVNFRVLPGDSVAGVFAHVRRVVNEPGVEIRALDTAAEPSPVSSTTSAAYRTLERSIREVLPDAIVAPYLVLGATDARYFHALSGNVYRFLPVRMTPADLDRLHGTDERIRLADYETAVRFYRQLIRNAAVP